MLRAYAVAYLAFLYAPIALLPIFAFNAGRNIAFPLQGLTLDWFAALGQRPALVDALGTSVTIAGATAVLATCLGTFAARAGTLFRFPARGGILALIMIPLVLPEIIVGVSLLVLLVNLGLPVGAWSIMAGHTLICTPFAVAILNASFGNLDRSLEEAAVDLGESRASAFARVTLPLIVPGLIASLLICFTISLDEFIIAFFLKGNTETLPTYLWGLLRFPRDIPVVMALGTCLVGLSIVLLALAEGVRRWGARRAGASARGGFVG